MFQCDGCMMRENLIADLRERIADRDAEIERLRVGGFLSEVAAEVDRARAKFPSPAGSMVALMEEVGELARAMLDEPDARVRAEAVQVAAMAMRVAEEGDPTLDDLRAVRGARDGVS